MKEGICQHCGRAIYLIQIGPVGWKWATDPNRPKSTWKCATKEYPVRSHSPARWPDEQEKPK